MAVRLLATVVVVLGLCASAASSFAAPELTTNGGFETGSFSGWTQSGYTLFTGVNSDFVHSGNYAAYFGSIGYEGCITQSLATTSGTTYALSFWLANHYGGTPNELSIWWGDVLVYDKWNFPAPLYAEYTLFVTANSPSTALKFGLRHDPRYLFLDDISVHEVASPVPEPASLLVWSVIGGVVLAGARLRRRRQPA